MQAAYAGGGTISTAATKAMAAKGLVNNEESWWYVQAGWEAKLNSLGKTTFWGDYWSSDVGSSVRSQGSAVRTLAAGDVLNSFATASNIVSSGQTAWGVGVTQNIDAAAMKLFIGYKRIEMDSLVLFNSATGTTKEANKGEALQIVYSGATIQF